MRRLLRWELLLVLAVFPLPSVLAALISAADYLVNGTASHYASNVVPHSPVLTGVLGVALELSTLAAAALVLYLLARNQEGSSSIGLDRTQPKVDAGYTMVVFLVGFVASFFIGGLIEGAAGIKAFPVHDSHNLAMLPVLLAGALVAGPVEEIVVLGYLVRRLEQLGVRPGWVVVIGTAVRASYHLYYGPGVIAIVIWAAVSILIYQRIRRLAPFIVVHSLWDLSIFLGAALSWWVVGVEVLVLLPLSVVAYVLWHPRRPTRPRPAGWGPPC
jgi:membrane protease YdiL (CAAX protease family)